VILHLVAGESFAAENVRNLVDAAACRTFAAIRLAGSMGPSLDSFGRHKPDM
jgi:hypothetical protein